MKYLSVCSGIEAATVAWHGLGWEPVAFAEIEAFPAAVLAHHYPTVPNLGDLTKYREWPEELLVEVDLLVGGTPCQAFSVAGQRRSLDDERGNLSLVYVNLYHHINEARKRHGRPPAIALWENVPGVLSTKDNAFGCFIGGLLGCDEAPETESGKWDKAGFLGSETVRVGYRVLDAQYFGVAQRRRRVFLAAVPCELVERFGERACPSEILSLRESVLGNPPTRGAAREGVARAPARCTAGGGLRTDFDCDGGVIKQVAKPLGESCPCVANPLTARMHKGINTTADEGQTPIVTHGGVFDGEPTCFHPTQDPISSTDVSAHAMGTGSKGGSSSHAVCVPGHRTHALTTRAAAVPAVAFTKSKRAQSNEDDESWVPGEVAPTQNQFDQGDTRATTVVAFTQNSRDEVRQISGDGSVAAALSADPGMHQTNYLAFAQNQLGEVRVNQNQNASGRNTPMVCGFAPLLGGRSMPVTQESPTLEAGTGNKAPAIQTAMQVRRLTPRECEFLQGFPPDYTDVTYRKKPAADGPRYRALGNSMAVPCMWWLGYRIQQAIG